MSDSINQEEYEESGELNPRMLKAAIIIAYGGAKKKAAEEVGVSPQTISYWGHNAAFSKLISDIKLDMMIESRNRLRSLLPLSLEKLESIITSSDSDSVKLKAIKLVLDQAKVTFPSTGLWDTD